MQDVMRRVNRKDANLLGRQMDEAWRVRDCPSLLSELCGPINVAGGVDFSCCHNNCQYYSGGDLHYLALLLPLHLQQRASELPLHDVMLSDHEY